MSTVLVFSTISGGYFVGQTAILESILNSDVKVNGYFGTSGGAITNCIGLKYSGTSKSMEKILYSIEPSIFAAPWVTRNHPMSLVLSPFISLFKNSFYKEAEGCKEFIEAYYTTSEFKNIDFWIGQYNATANFSSLVCTCAKENSLFFNQLSNKQQSYYIQEITGTYDIKYIDGDIDKLSNALEASASIPGWKPPVPGDDGHSYIDGGVCSATPATSLSDIFVKYSLDNPGDVFQIFYNIGPKYIDKKIENLEMEGHWSGQIINTINFVMNFSIHRERQLMINTWLKMAGKNVMDDTIKNKRVSGRTNIKEFIDTIKNRNFFATCYSEYDKVSIINFTKKDLETTYKKAQENVFFEFLYI